MNGPLARFGALILRERAARRWSVRDVAGASGVSLSAISLAERGQVDLRLSNALKIARVLGIDLNDIADPPPCQTCHGVPPPGFTCNECGRGEPR